MHELAKGLIDGDVRSLARAMRCVDDRVGGAIEILKDVFPKTGRAYVIGVTGNPGAGKSTLSDRLIEGYRKQGKTVGVLCVDPSSPYSGGAILGDRIRMQRHATDPGVFIRSVATRGHLGGLSRSARDLVRLLDASGSEIILVETVGVGQDELEITRTAHTTLVVMAPGMGDEVQAIKAGLMESADVFAVNKADRDGADATIRDIELMIALGSETMIAAGKNRAHVVHGSSAGTHGATEVAGTFTPPVVRCIATRGEGVSDVLAAIEKHRAWLEGTEEGRARRRARLGEEVRDGLREALIDAAVHDLGADIQAAVDAVESKALDPYTATEKLIEKFRG